MSGRRIVLHRKRDGVGFRERHWILDCKPVVNGRGVDAREAFDQTQGRAGSSVSRLDDVRGLRLGSGSLPGARGWVSGAENGRSVAQGRALIRLSSFVVG